MEQMPDFSRLHSYVADSQQDGPSTVLVIKGFADEEEVMRFFDALYERGILLPPDQPQN